MAHSSASLRSRRSSARATAGPSSARAGANALRPKPGCARASIWPMEGQYVAYSFYRVDPAWRRLPVEERVAGKDAFAEVVEDWASRMESLRPYTVTGVRPDSDFFLWKITQRYEDLGELG